MTFNANHFFFPEPESGRLILVMLLICVIMVFIFINFVYWLHILQIVIWFIIPASRSHHSRRANHNNNALALIVLLQYVPRLYLIFPLSSEIIKATGVVTKTAWAGAAYNLLLYMLASHVSHSSVESFLGREHVILVTKLWHLSKTTRN